MSSSVIGPVLPAMSFVPARMTTAFGFRLRTSGRKRMSICGVVWPLMPRLDVALAREELAEALLGPHVGDRVAHEHDVDRSDGAIGVAVAGKLRPVAQPARRWWQRRGVPLASSGQPRSAGGSGAAC